MKVFSQWKPALCAALLGARSVSAIALDLGSTDSIKQAASTIAYGMMKYYTGNNTGDVPGNLPAPYYWWEAGAMFGAMIDYWYYTGDTTYNDVTTQAMLWQVGSDKNFMPTNQTKTLGNDDQSFWGLAAMSAAEQRFPNPPPDQPQWLALAQAVFNSQALRWDETSCAGGLKWQIFTFNNGYNYKNTISNGCFFNMAARLARYTGNNTYADWANRAWDWTARVGLMSPTYQFFDGSDDNLNCTQVNHIQWSYNAGVYLLGAATMYNITGDELWRQRTEAILNATAVFFTENPPNVMTEIACEQNGKCDVDQRSFKAYLARWMAATTKAAPFTYDAIKIRLAASAQAAAASCVGGNDGQQCAMRWYQGPTHDGSFGVGEQMCALEVIQSNLIANVDPPVTNSTGGTSIGNPSAGTGGDDRPADVMNPITTGDKAGAGILTTVIIIGILGGAWWMVA